MNESRILSIDPVELEQLEYSLLMKDQKEFYQCQKKEWKDHLTFIINLIKEKQPNLILYEDTNYIHRKTKDGLSLFRLLGAIESLSYLFTVRDK